MTLVSSIALKAAFLCRGNDEVADAPAFEFGGALHDSQDLGGNARLDAGGAVRFLSHDFTSLLPVSVHRDTVPRSAPMTSADALIFEVLGAYPVHQSRLMPSCKRRIER